VRDEQQRLPAFPGLAEQAEHFTGRSRVEIPGRLIGEHDVRTVRERACQCYPLLLPA
jgi:hypothetical protein